MSESSPKRLMFAHVARLAQAFASPVRVEIVDLLVQAPRDVHSIASALRQSPANASQHLRAMRRAGVVDATKAGKSVVYQIHDTEIAVVYHYLSRATDIVLADAMQTRVRHYAPRDALPPIAISDLERAIVRDRALLVDVRPRLEYEHEHLAGAISLPLPEIDHRVSELPKHRPIITYCRGPHCTYSYDALGLIRPTGRAARRLSGGFLGWKVWQFESELARLRPTSQPF